MEKIDVSPNMQKKKKHIVKQSKETEEYALNEKNKIK